jgi:hypothetical protein
MYSTTLSAYASFERERRANIQINYNCKCMELPSSDVVYRVRKARLGQ